MAQSSVSSRLLGKFRKAQDPTDTPKTDTSHSPAPEREDSLSLAVAGNQDKPSLKEIQLSPMDDLGYTIHSISHLKIAKASKEINSFINKLVQNDAYTNAIQASRYYLINARYFNTMLHINNAILSRTALDEYESNGGLRDDCDLLLSFVFSIGERKIFFTPKELNQLNGSVLTKLKDELGDLEKLPRADKHRSRIFSLVKRIPANVIRDETNRKRIVDWVQMNFDKPSFTFENFINECCNVSSQFRKDDDEKEDSQKVFENPTTNYVFSNVISWGNSIHRDLPYTVSFHEKASMGKGNMKQLEMLIKLYSQKFSYFHCSVCRTEEKPLFLPSILPKNKCSHFVCEDCLANLEVCSFGCGEFNDMDFKFISLSKKLQEPAEGA